MLWQHSLEKSFSSSWKITLGINFTIIGLKFQHWKIDSTLNVETLPRVNILRYNDKTRVSFYKALLSSFLVKKTSFTGNFCKENSRKQKTVHNIAFGNLFWVPRDIRILCQRLFLSANGRGPPEGPLHYINCLYIARAYQSGIANLCSR